MFLLLNEKELGHVLNILYLILFPIIVFHSSYCCFVFKLSSVSILKNLYEALNDPKSRKEVKALHKNNAWDLIELPNGKKAVGCVWVFIVKHKFDGSMKQYKAILVAKVLHKPTELIMRRHLFL